MRFKRTPCTTLLLPAAVSLGLADSALAAQYSVQALATTTNTLSNSSSPWVFGLNESGKAVGYRDFSTSSPLSSGSSAVLYDHGVQTDLMPLLFFPDPNYSANYHIATAINDADQTVGYSRLNGTYQPFLTTGAGVNYLGTLGGASGYGYDVNQRGQAVGGSSTAANDWHATLYDVDATGLRSVVDLEAASGTSGGTAYGINSSGQIVGGTLFGGGNCAMRAFIYANGQMTNLGRLGTGCYSSADAINSQGQVVGWSYTSGFFSQHGFLYENGSMADLGTLGGDTSQARDLNNNGRVVGWATTATAASAFLYANGQMLDLNNLLPTGSGWVLTDAFGINDQNQIVGEGTLNGVRSIFLLTPAYPVANAGTDTTVKEADAVTLNGGTSSAPGCTAGAGSACLTHFWRQLAGPAVTLDLSNAVLPKFTAPALPTGKKSDVLTFELVVKDDLFASSPATVNITVQHVNIVPVAEAGTAQTVNEGSPVSLDGSASYDPDGIVGNPDYLAYAWSNPALAGDACATIVLTGAATVTPHFDAPLVGATGLTCSFALAVTDADQGVSAPATTTVTIQNVNHPPVADAGTDLTVTEGDTPVTLNGSASTDPDSDPLSYSWTQLSGPTVTLTGASSATPSFTAPQVGPANDALTFELTVDDGLGGSSADQVVVTVLDQTAPPACSKGRVKIETEDFWPPNHKLKQVEIEGLGEDRMRMVTGSKHSEGDHDDVFVHILAITQDEPTSGLDGSDASPDAAVTPDDGEDKILLRAERAGNGNGRVYQIRYSATDKSGQSCQGTVNVCVPPSKGKKATCIDDGQHFDSFVK